MTQIKNDIPSAKNFYNDYVSRHGLNDSLVVGLLVEWANNFDVDRSTNIDIDALQMAMESLKSENESLKSQIDEKLEEIKQLKATIDKFTKGAKANKQESKIE